MNINRTNNENEHKIKTHMDNVTKLGHEHGHGYGHGQQHRHGPWAWTWTSEFCESMYYVMI